MLLSAAFCLCPLPLCPLAGAGNRMPILPSEAKPVLEKSFLRLSADAAVQQSVCFDPIVFPGYDNRDLKIIKRVYRLSSPKYA